MVNSKGIEKEMKGIPNSEVEIIRKIFCGAAPVLKNQAKCKQAPLGFLSAPEPSPIEYAYINNPNGTIRWIFPIEGKRPTHLSLYNSHGLKPMVYRLASRALYKMGLSKHLYSGTLEIPFEWDQVFKELIEKVPHDNFAIFTGTTGENRKSIIALENEGHVSNFIKLAHTDKAQKLLQHESYALTILNQRSFRFLDYPKLSKSPTDRAVILSNIKPTKAKTSSKIGKLHLQMLKEMYRHFWHARILIDTPFYKEVRSNIAHIYEATVKDPSLDKQAIARLANGLKVLLQSLNIKSTCEMSFSHGDFTPWNCFMGKDKLHVYDWELAYESMPLLYDFFHFNYQSGILLQRNSFDGIRSNIEKALNSQEGKAIVKIHNIDVGLHHRLYLLYVISYYLRIYVDEPQVHMQVHWLIRTWDEALKYWLN